MLEVKTVIEKLKSKAEGVIALEEDNITTSNIVGNIKTLVMQSIRQKGIQVSTAEKICVYLILLLALQNQPKSEMENFLDGKQLSLF